MSATSARFRFSDPSPDLAREYIFRVTAPRYMARFKPANCGASGSTSRPGASLLPTRDSRALGPGAGPGRGVGTAPTAILESLAPTAALERLGAPPSRRVLISSGRAPGAPQSAPPARGIVPCRDSGRDQPRASRATRSPASGPGIRVATGRPRATVTDASAVATAGGWQRRRGDHVPIVSPWSRPA